MPGTTEMADVDSVGEVVMAELSITVGAMDSAVIAESQAPPPLDLASVAMATQVSDQLFSATHQQTLVGETPDNFHQIQLFGPLKPQARRCKSTLLVNCRYFEQSLRLSRHRPNGRGYLTSYSSVTHQLDQQRTLLAGLSQTLPQWLVEDFALAKIQLTLAMQALTKPVTRSIRRTCPVSS